MHYNETDGEFTALFIKNAKSNTVYGHLQPYCIGLCLNHVPMLQDEICAALAPGIRMQTLSWSVPVLRIRISCANVLVYFPDDTGQKYSLQPTTPLFFDLNFRKNILRNLHKNFKYGVSRAREEFLK